MNGKKNSARKQSGSTLIELAAIGFIMPLVAVLCVTVGTTVFAAYVNDSTCRDAARAASQRSNATDAYKVADLVVHSHSQNHGAIVSSLVLLGAAPGAGDASSKYFEYKTFDDSSSPSNDDANYVRVSTQLIATLPAPIAFDGKKLSNQLKLKQSYVFPIVQQATAREDSDDSEDEILSLDDEDDRQVKEEAEKEELEASTSDIDEDPQ